MADTAPYGQMRSRMADISGVVMVIGGADTGKTTVARMLLSDAVDAGRTVAYVDADLAASTVGPAGCVGLSVVETAADLENLSDPDELRFVGAVEPNGVVLPHVAAQLHHIAPHQLPLICSTHSRLMLSGGRSGSGK